MEWMLLPLKRYADFSGRSRRKEYWMFTLGVALLYGSLAIMMLGGLDESSGDFSPVSGFFLILWIVAGLAIIVPAVAVQVRRFHDQDKSGWFVLLNLIPYIGGLVVLVMMCLEGTKGPNRFGADPKEVNNEPAVA
jgi:uncharacterized membrane protein YhaH (DUF805 family)